MLVKQRQSGHCLRSGIGRARRARQRRAQCPCEGKPRFSRASDFKTADFGGAFTSFGFASTRFELRSPGFTRPEIRKKKDRNTV